MIETIYYVGMFLYIFYLISYAIVNSKELAGENFTETIAITFISIIFWPIVVIAFAIDNVNKYFKNKDLK